MARDRAVSGLAVLVYIDPRELLMGGGELVVGAVEPRRGEPAAREQVGDEYDLDGGAARREGGGASHTRAVRRGGRKGGATAQAPGRWDGADGARAAGYGRRK